MRTQKPRKVTTAVRFPQELHDRLTRESEQRDVSINLLVTKAVQRYLDQLPPVALP